MQLRHYSALTWCFFYGGAKRKACVRFRRILVSAVAVLAYMSESRADMASLPLPDYPDFIVVSGRPPSFTKDGLCNIAAQVAAVNNLPVSFFTNLIHQESGFLPHVVSRAGAQGIAQFMPYVAVENGLDDPFEPATALLASGKLLADLGAQFGNLGLAAAAYNAGPKRVQDWLDNRGTLPAETKQYVLRITGRSADQWARHDLPANVMMLPIARCPRPEQKGGPVHQAGSPSKASTFSPESPGSIRTGGLRRRALPQPSQFAIGIPVTQLVRRLELEHKKRSASTKRAEPAMMIHLDGHTKYFERGKIRRQGRLGLRRYG